VLSIGARPAARGGALARYAQRQLNVSRAVLLTDGRVPLATAFAEGLAKEWPGGPDGLSRLDYERPEQRAELVKRIQDTKPGAAVLAVRPAEFRALRAALRQAGWRAPVLYGGEDVGANALLRDAADDPALYLVTVFIRDGLTADGKALASRYEERFRQPLDLPAAQAYDAARLLFAALKETGPLKRNRLGEVLKGRQTYESLTGTVTWKDRQPHRRLFVVRSAEGKRAVVQTVTDPPEG
jgi:ABC-type branched-subunit amino acid transport system substrate-binding protein